MTTLNLATPEDAERTLALVAAFHKEFDLSLSDQQRQKSVMPLLDGTPHGSLYLAGPRRAPIGYVAVSLGWSIELGGLDAFVDEFYLRPGVRGRGIGGEMLSALARILRADQVRALHLEVDRTNLRTQAFYGRNGFRLRDRYTLMSIDL